MGAKWESLEWDLIGRKGDSDGRGTRGGKEMYWRMVAGLALFFSRVLQNNKITLLYFAWSDWSIMTMMEQTMIEQTVMD